MNFNEFITLGLENPVSDLRKPFNEMAYAELALSKAKAIYPLIRAITTAKITRNSTFYPAESMLNIGLEKEAPTGYLSFLYPYARPVITEHRLQDDGSIKGDEPIGRIVSSFWKGHTSEKATGLKPGFIEGDGALYLVPAITDPEGIRKISGGIYQTVSIGTKVKSAIESVTGVDLANPKEGDELPQWRPGTVVEDKKGNRQLSFLTMDGIEGRELSFVNAPSDTHAQIQKKDLGKSGIRLLTGHKTREGVKFYDISTREQVFVESTNINSESFENSYDFSENTAAPTYKITTEAYETTIKIDSFVEFSGIFGNIEGKVVNIYTDGVIESSTIKLQASPSNPVARIRIYKDGKPTKIFVNKNTAVLLQKEK